MAQPIVLVTFYSRGGTTEALAHAAAVGAVQGRANIRLRRMPDGNADDVLARFPDAAESLRRMHKEYVAPREADLLAADAIVVASPDGMDAHAPEWTDFLTLVSRLGTGGSLNGKVAAVVPTAAAASFDRALRECRLETVECTADDTGDDVARAVALGRQVAAAAQRAKTS